MVPLIIIWASFALYPPPTLMLLPMTHTLVGFHGYTCVYLINWREQNINKPIFVSFFLSPSSRPAQCPLVQWSSLPSPLLLTWKPPTPLTWLWEMDVRRLIWTCCQVKKKKKRAGGAASDSQLNSSHTPPPSVCLGVQCRHFLRDKKSVYSHSHRWRIRQQEKDPNADQGTRQDRFSELLIK